jgi:hypothetical protein
MTKGILYISSVEHKLFINELELGAYGLELELRAYKDIECIVKSLSSCANK